MQTPVRAQATFATGLDTQSRSLAEVVTQARQLDWCLCGAVTSVDGMARAAVARAIAILRRCREIDPPPNRVPAARSAAKARFNSG